MRSQTAGSANLEDEGAHCLGRACPVPDARLSISQRQTNDPRSRLGSGTGSPRLLPDFTLGKLRRNLNLRLC